MYADSFPFTAVQASFLSSRPPSSSGAPRLCVKPGPSPPLRGKPLHTGLWQGPPGCDRDHRAQQDFPSAVPQSDPPWMCLRAACWGSPWPLRTAFSPALWTSCWSSSSVIITSTSWRSSSSWPAAPRRWLWRSCGGWDGSRSPRSACSCPRWKNWRSETSRAAWSNLLFTL